MLRQIMIVNITPLGHAQIYNQCVRSVFIVTGINTHYNNNSNNNNNTTTKTETNCVPHTNVIMVFNRSNVGKII